LPHRGGQIVENETAQGGDERLSGQLRARIRRVAAGLMHRSHG
jgi:hypothetical protein